MERFLKSLNAMKEEKGEVDINLDELIKIFNNFIETKISKILEPLFTKMVNKNIKNNKDFPQWLINNDIMLKNMIRRWIIIDGGLLLFDKIEGDGDWGMAGWDSWGEDERNFKVVKHNIMVEVIEKELKNRFEKSRS